MGSVLAMAILSNALCLTLHFWAVNCIKDAAFKKTENLTLSSWNAAVTRDLTLSTHLHCAAACLKSQSSCNAWKFDDNSLLCSMGQIEYLEDTDGTPTVEIHVEIKTIAEVDMKCRGSARCCTIQSCGLMEGACTDDEECDNGLICSSDVCPTGALWDSEDKCCEQRCTTAHPCLDGEGQCSTSDDC